MNVREIKRVMLELDEGYDRSSIPFPPQTPYLAPDAQIYGRTVVFPDYGDDDEDMRDLPDLPDVYVPTQASTATRLPPKRSKFHVRGYLPNPRSNRAVSFSSLLEMRAAAMLVANVRCVDIRDQPEPLTYVTRDGILHRHTPDYFATFDNGTKALLAVRPSSRVEKNLAETVELIRQQSLAGYADEIVILTERVLTPEAGWNATSTIRALRGRNEADCEKLRWFARRFSGIVTARVLLDQFTNEGEGWNAIWCLLFDRDLKHVQPHRRLIDSPYLLWTGGRS